MGKYFLPIFFYITLIVVSCSSSAKTEIVLFNGHKYLLKPNERLLKKDKAVLALADSLKNLYNKEKLVLFKYIAHKNYDTFLFIDLDSTIKKSNIYKQKQFNNKRTVFYQHILDEKNEITSITLFQNDDFLEHFTEDKISTQRFKIKK